MSTQQIGIVCAIIGIVLTPIYLKMGFSGLKILQQIRDALKRQ